MIYREINSKGDRVAMNRTTLQIMLLLFWLVVCAGGYFLGKHLLNRPFKATNDALHEKNATFTLDFLIPAGTHIDKKMTIGHVLRLHAQKEGSIYEKMIRGLSDMIPTQYRFVGNALLFLFWTFLFMTFLSLLTSSRLYHHFSHHPEMKKKDDFPKIILFV
jgi:hypothetical protein